MEYLLIFKCAFFDYTCSLQLYRRLDHVHWFSHTSKMEVASAIQTIHQKSVSNRFVIKFWMASLWFCLKLFIFSASIEAFVIGLSKISSLSLQKLQNYIFSKWFHVNVFWWLYIEMKRDKFELTHVTKSPIPTEMSIRRSNNRKTTENMPIKPINLKHWYWNNQKRIKTHGDIGSK